MIAKPFLQAKDGLPARNSQDWAKRKHYYLNNYCHITSVGMKNKWRVVYVDVMAGPGVCKIEETGEEFPGSPLVALDHEFANYIFIEGNEIAAAALQARVSKHPKARKTKVIGKDWLEVLEAGGLKFDARTLVVAFVDPTGITQTPIAAVRKLLMNRRIDLLITIQHRLGIAWNTHQYRNNREGQTAVDAFLGSQIWHQWEDRDPTEFARLSVEHFCKELRKEGLINPPHISVPDPHPIYRLAYFTRHPKGEEFWRKIIGIDETGQRGLDLDL